MKSNLIMRENRQNIKLIVVPNYHCFAPSKTLRRPFLSNPLWTTLNKKYTKDLYIIGAEILNLTTPCPMITNRATIDPHIVFRGAKFESKLEKADFLVLKHNKSFMNAAKE